MSERTAGEKLRELIGPNTETAFWSQEELEAVAQAIRAWQPPPERKERKELAEAKAERDRLLVELDTERMRLAACDVVALADTPESAANARKMHPKFHSAACSTVERRVDECIALRQTITEQQTTIDRLREAAKRAASYMEEHHLPHGARLLLRELEDQKMNTEEKRAMDQMIDEFKVKLAAVERERDRLREGLRHWRTKCVCGETDQLIRDLLRELEGQK